MISAAQDPGPTFGVGVGVCSIDGSPLFPTIVGPRCPICGATGFGRSRPHAVAA